MRDESPDSARVRLRGTRAGLGFVIVVAVLFIGASTWQIVRAGFPGLGLAGGGALRALAAALDRAASGVVPSAPEGAPEESAAAFRRGLSPEWNMAADVE